VTDEEDEADLREALRSLHRGDGELGEVLRLVNAALDDGRAWIFERCIDAVVALRSIEGDLANGGIDQVVWNRPPEANEALAAAFSRVGAVELATLLRRLDKTRAEVLLSVSSDRVSAAADADPVRDFLRFRTLVGGPDLAIVSPHLEVGESLVEAASEAADELADPEGPAPPMRARQ